MDLSHIAHFIQREDDELIGYSPFDAGTDQDVDPDARLVDPRRRWNIEHVAMSLAEYQGLQAFFRSHVRQCESFALEELPASVRAWVPEADMGCQARFDIQKLVCVESSGMAYLGPVRLVEAPPPAGVSERAPAWMWDEGTP